MSIDFSKVENRDWTLNEFSDLQFFVEGLEEAMKPFVRLSPEDKQRIVTISFNNLLFVKDARAAALAFPDIFPPFIDRAGFERSYNYFHQLTELELQFNRLAEMVRDTRQLTGALLFRDARAIYRVLQAGAGHSLPGYEAMMKRMRQRFKNQGPGLNQEETKEIILNSRDQGPDETMESLNMAA